MTAPQQPQGNECPYDRCPTCKRLVDIGAEPCPDPWHIPGPLQRPEADDARGEFCEVCGKLRDEHPPGPPPGPPPPPPAPRGNLDPNEPREVWIAPHEFRSSGLTFAEVLAERDTQIDLWRRRAFALRRWVDRIPDKPEGWTDG